MSEPILRLMSASKRFDEAAALSEVSFDVFAGEIHALVGENGAGKSTLVNILAGVLLPDSGVIEVAGEVRKIRSPREARALGIATVFQELSLASPVSIAENIFAGRLPTKAGFVDWRALREATLKLLNDFNIAVDPDAPLAGYPVATRQLVEIAKAISLEARVLLLDEPTSALDQADRNRLFDVLHALAAKGIGIVYISHHLNEVISLSHRITVLRDGRVSARFQTSDASSDMIVRAMVGRDPGTGGERMSAKSGAGVLVARDMRKKTVLHGVNLTLHAGEIVALAGLIGSGRSEFAQALCGLAAIDSGTLDINGVRVRFRDLRAAMARSIGYIPSERKTDGLFLDLSVSDNVAAASLARLARHGFADSKREVRLAQRFVERLGIRLRDIGDPVRRLSGGNQQKVLLAKWLATAPSVLIVEEPTRGVDILAKFEIHRVLRELTSSGTAILLVSSDLPEIVSLAHRIVVMRHGRVIGELPAEEGCEEMVTALASGLAVETERTAA